MPSSAGHDAHRFAAPDRTLESASGEGRADVLQASLALGRQVGTSHRPAVHCRVVVGRHVDRRNHVPGEYATERLTHEDALAAADRFKHVEQDGAGTIDRQ